MTNIFRDLARLLQILVDCFNKLWPFRGLTSRPPVTPAHISAGHTLLSLPDELLLQVLDHVRFEIPSGQSHYQQTHNVNSDLFNYNTYRVPAGHNERSGLQAFASVNRRFRYLAEPALFRTLYISPGWRYAHALKILPALQGAAPALQRFTRTVKIDLEDHGEYDAHKKVRKPIALPAALFAFLPTLHRLETLAIRIYPMPNTLERDSGLQGIVLPQVRTLALSPTLGWLVPLCPNVESLVVLDCQVNDEIRRTNILDLMFRNAATLPMLRHLQPGLASWDHSALQTVCKHFAAPMSTSPAARAHSGSFQPSPPPPQASVSPALQPHLLRGLTLSKFSFHGRYPQVGTALVATLTTCLPHLELLALLDDPFLLALSWIDVQGTTPYRPPLQPTFQSLQPWRLPQKLQWPPITHRVPHMAEASAGAGTRAPRCISEDPHRAVAFAVLSRLANLRFLFLGSQTRVRVIQRDIRSTRILVEIEWRPRWGSWEDAISGKPLLHRQQQLGFDYPGEFCESSVDVETCVLGAGYKDHEFEDDTFGADVTA